MKLNWSQLKKYHLSPPKTTLKRNKKIEEEYTNFKKSLNISIGEYIYNKYFNSSSELFVIDANMFPYNVENNVYHLICWVNPNHKKAEDFNEYDLIIHLIKNKIYDFIIFENENNNKSIPSIKHFHLFLKN